MASLFSAARESIAELCEWMVWCNREYSLKDSLAFVSSCDAKWEAGTQYNFVVYDLRDGTFLGSIGLSGINPVHRFANLGYWVRRCRTRRGVASTAVRLAARFAFEELGLNRIELIIATENQASIRVAEKAGAHREGILRARVVLGGKPCDAVSYSLLAADWETKKRVEARAKAPTAHAPAAHLVQAAAR